YQQTGLGVAAGYVFTLDQATAQQLAQPTGGQYITVAFNAPVAGGTASELDPGNLDLGGTADINITSLLGSAGSRLVPPTSTNIINLSIDIAAHELGHLAGLQHQDALGPIGSGIFSGIDPTLFYPTYTGPRNAAETAQDVMATPDAVGSTLLDA